MSKKIGDLIKKKRPENECCICGKKFTSYGNNPWPVADKGECCDECNFDVVLPARLKKAKKEETREEVEDKLTTQPYELTLQNPSGTITTEIKKSLDEMKKFQKELFDGILAHLDAIKTPVLSKVYSAGDYFEITTKDGTYYAIIDIPEAENMPVDDACKAQDEDKITLQYLIDDEYEAIDGYKKAIAQAKNPALISVLSHILDEETQHVEELNAAQSGKYEDAESVKDAAPKYFGSEAINAAVSMLTTEIANQLDAQTDKLEKMIDKGEITRAAAEKSYKEKEDLIEGVLYKAYYDLKSTEPKNPMLLEDSVVKDGDFDRINAALKTLDVTSEITMSRILGNLNYMVNNGDISLDEANGKFNAAEENIAEIMYKADNDIRALRPKSRTAAKDADNFIYVASTHYDYKAFTTLAALQKFAENHADVQMFKIPKTVWNPIYKMAKEANIANPIKFTVNRIIREQNDKIERI